MTRKQALFALLGISSVGTAAAQNIGGGYITPDDSPEDRPWFDVSSLKRGDDVPVNCPAGLAEEFVELNQNLKDAEDDEAISPYSDRDQDGNVVTMQPDRSCTQHGSVVKGRVVTITLDQIDSLVVNLGDKRVTFSQGELWEAIR